MIIPIRTDYRMSHRPWVNYAIVAINVMVFILGYNGMAGGKIDFYILHPDEPQLHQFFTSVFLHAGWSHLLGNMLFLWVFGNAMNDRFGHLGYFAFYLAGGVLACIGYLVLGATMPVLGASGAISAVTGAYLVLLPRARVTLLLLLWVIMPFEVSSLYFLLFQFIWNIWLSVTSEMAGQAGGGVAYVAHSSGYAFGIAVAALLLGIKALPRDPFDLLNLLRTFRRRQSYRRMVSTGYNPYSPVGEHLRRGQARTSATTISPTAEEVREYQLRQDISVLLDRHDLTSAADKYLQLVQVAEDPVLPRQQQLDIANQLMATEHHPAAADAYERFLRHYEGSYEHIPDIYLMLGLLYSRYLHQYDQARNYLQKAVERLQDQRKLDLARTELRAIS